MQETYKCKKYDYLKNYFVYHHIISRSSLYIYGSTFPASFGLIDITSFSFFFFAKVENHKMELFLACPANRIFNLSLNAATVRLWIINNWYCDYFLQYYEMYVPERDYLLISIIII